MPSKGKVVSAARASANPDLGFTASELEQMTFSVAEKFLRIRRPGGVTIAEFARKHGISPTAAKATLETARRAGALTCEPRVIDPKSGRSCTVYYKAERPIRKK